MTESAWPVIASVIGASSAIIGGLILLNLKSIKHCIKSNSDRLSKNETDVQDVKDRMAACRTECTRTYVDKVDYIRNVTKQENSLDSLIKITSEIKGGMAIVEKIPQICGEVARQIVKESKNE